MITASASETVLGFAYKSGQTNNFKIGIHSFPAWRSALKGQCGEQAGKFTCCAVGKALSGIPPSWRDRQMLATPKRACYSALIAFS